MSERAIAFPYIGKDVSGRKHYLNSETGVEIIAMATLRGIFLIYVPNRSLLGREELTRAVTLQDAREVGGYAARGVRTAIANAYIQAHTEDHVRSVTR